jgi:chorismate mutase/prephenate dehydratase
MTDAKRELEELRQELGRVDAQLLVAIERRGKISRRIGELRKDQPPALPLGDRAAIRALVARSSGDMPAESLREILREIYAACVALELPVRIAYVGPEGAAGHVAARGRFGAGANLAAAENAAGALDEVARRRAEYAVVPFENSVDGPVQATLAAIAGSDLKICEQVETKLDLCLMNRTGNAGDIEKIYATPADKALCQGFLGSTKAAVMDVRTPMMACQLAVDDHGAAAVAAEVFGAQVGLEVARRNVLDASSERVRWAVVGARPSSRTGNDATGFVFTVQDAPGSLLDVLRQFSERGINMTKIQSRPIEGEPWTYLFFVEATGHFTDRALISAFEEIKRITKSFRVLGSYPAL